MDLWLTFVITVKEGLAYASRQVRARRLLCPSKGIDSFVEIQFSIEKEGCFDVGNINSRSYEI